MGGPVGGAKDRDSRLDESAFLAASIDRFADWIKFAEAKAGGALLLVGLGVNDMLANAARLSSPVSGAGRPACIPVLLFWLGLIAVGGSVVTIWQAFFPTLVPQNASLYYFGDVAKYASADDYLNDVRRSRERLNTEVAYQVWELARIADTKFTRTKIAYMWVALFGTCWVGARVTLSLIT